MKDREEGDPSRSRHIKWWGWHQSPPVNHQLPHEAEHPQPMLRLALDGKLALMDTWLLNSLLHSATWVFLKHTIWLMSYTGPTTCPAGWLQAMTPWFAVPDPVSDSLPSISSFKSHHAELQCLQLITNHYCPSHSGPPTFLVLNLTVTSSDKFPLLPAPTPAPFTILPVTVHLLEQFWIEGKNILEKGSS